jgi:hypothetical protein
MPSRLDCTGRLVEGPVRMTSSMRGGGLAVAVSTSARSSGRQMLSARDQAFRASRPALIQACTGHEVYRGKEDDEAVGEMVEEEDTDEAVIAQKAP